MGRVAVCAAATPPRLCFLPGLQPVEDLDRGLAAFEKVGKDLGVIGKLVTA